MAVIVCKGKKMFGDIKILRKIMFGNINFLYKTMFRNIIYDSSFVIYLTLLPSGE